MDYGFFTDGEAQSLRDETEKANPLLVVKVEPSMMLWKMLVQCNDVEDQAAIKDTFDFLIRVDCTIRQ